MSVNRKRVFAHVKPDRLIVESAEDASVWSGSTDVSNVDTNTNHREGTVSMSFDKSGTTEAFGQIAQTFDSDNQLNLVEYLRGQIRFWVNLSDLTNVANVQLIIGEDATDNYVYQVADTDLSTGWNEVTFDVDSPTSTGGAGAAWSSIGYLAIKVNFDAAANTLTEILVDAVSVLVELNVNVENINLAGTGLATAANQTTMITLVQTEDAVHSTGDKGVMMLAVRNDTLAAVVDTDGDYSALQVSDLGGLWVELGTGLNRTDDKLGAIIEADANATGCDTLFDADGDNTAQECKSGAGVLYGFSISNPNAADAYLQVFDLATGSVTVGTTTPKQSYLIPAGNGTDDGARELWFVTPIGFATAITYACTTTATGSGDPTTGLVVNLLYK